MIAGFSQSSRVIKHAFQTVFHVKKSDLGVNIGNVVGVIFGLS